MGTLSLDSGFLFLFLHCPISFLFSSPVPAHYSSNLHPFAEPVELQKMVIAGESGGVFLELGAAVVWSAKHFPSRRWRIPFDENERHKDYLGRRKEKTPNFVALLSSSPFKKRRISGSFSHVKCFYANICYEPDMCPCSGSAGLLLWFFSPCQGIS